MTRICILLVIIIKEIFKILILLTFNSQKQEMQNRIKSKQNILPNTSNLNPKPAKEGVKTRNQIKKDIVNPQKNDKQKKKYQSYQQMVSFIQEQNINCAKQKLTRLPAQQYYEEDIYQYVIQNSTQQHKKFKQIYEKNKSSLTYYSRYRECFIESIYQQSFALDLKRKTLFLAVNYLDSYVLRSQESKLECSDLYILWTYAAFLMAQKFEEIYPPSISEWLPKANHNKVYRQEGKIIYALNFKFNCETVQNYLEYFAHKFKLSEQQIYNCQLVLDLILFDFKILINNSPQKIAKAVVYMEIKKRCHRLPGYNTMSKLMEELSLIVIKNPKRIKWIFRQRNKNKVPLDFCDLSTSTQSS